MDTDIRIITPTTAKQLLEALFDLLRSRLKAGWKNRMNKIATKKLPTVSAL